MAHLLNLPEFCSTLSDDVTDNQTNKDKHAQNILALVDLKFILENEIAIHEENLKNSKNNLLRNVSSDLDIYAVFRLYENNIKIYSKTYFKKQEELLKQINEILLQKCEHNWIEDVIDGIFSNRNICYCSKCFIRKS